MTVKAPHPFLHGGGDREGVTNLMADLDADDQRIRDQQFLLQIAHAIVDKWDELALYLGLDESDVSAIKHNNRNDYEQQKSDFLRLWRRRFADKATFERLFQAATALRRAQLAKQIKRITGKFPQTLEVTHNMCSCPCQS